MADHPSLAQVNCTAMRFQPGDRIIVRVFKPLTDAQAMRLRKTVEKWAGNIVEVLIVNALAMDIQVEHADERNKLQLPEGAGG